MLPQAVPPPSAPVPQGGVRLDDWGVIRATGADARSFLQGQLTQDVASLQPGQARLAGYCSAKGRLLATFVVWPRGADELLLACSADLLPVAVKRLSMFVLRAKCRLSDASGEVPLWGIAGDAAGAALGPVAAGVGTWTVAAAAGGDLLRLPDAAVDGQAVPRWLWAGAAAATEPVAAAQAPLPALAASDWRGLEAASGVARVVTATVEQFVPQMVNLELVGGVSFSKGCYPGQEVVARSQYRGTLKRRGFVVTSADPLAPGAEVYASADPAQPAGMVVNAGTLGDGRHVAFVELKLAAADDSLHAASVQGPALAPASPQPYGLPAEAN